MVGYGRGGAHGRLVAALGTAIVGGELAPGDGVDPEALEARFGMSRSAVREGLRVLTAKGLVGARPRHGTYVEPRERWAMLDPDVLAWRFAGGPDAGFLDELGEVRLTVEPAAARLAAQRRSDEDLAALDAALRGMRAAAAGPAERTADADVAFHRALLRAGHNELLVHMWAAIETGLRLRDRFVHAALRGLPGATAVAQHAEVLAAVRRERPRAAEAAMRALVEQSIADVTAARARP